MIIYMFLVCIPPFYPPLFSETNVQLPREHVSVFSCLRYDRQGFCMPGQTDDFEPCTPERHEQHPHRAPLHVHEFQIRPLLGYRPQASRHISSEFQELQQSMYLRVKDVPCLTLFLSIWLAMRVWTSVLLQFWTTLTWTTYTSISWSRVTAQAAFRCAGGSEAITAAAGSAVIRLLSL